MHFLICALEFLIAKIRSGFCSKREDWRLSAGSFKGAFWSDVDKLRLPQGADIGPGEDLYWCFGFLKEGTKKHSLGTLILLNSLMFTFQNLRTSYYFYCAHIYYYSFSLSSHITQFPGKLRASSHTFFLKASKGLDYIMKNLCPNSQWIW